MKFLPLALLLCLSLPSQVRAGEVYRWIDDSGQVHFSDVPRVDRYQSYDPPSDNAVQFGTEGAEDFFANQARARDERARLKSENKAQRAQAAQQCQQASDRLRFLSERSPNRILITGEDGQPARMTVEQWNEQRAQEQGLVTKYCGR